MDLGLAAALVAGAVVLALAGLTAVGERRRGHGAGVALVAGVFFPVTWVAWYVRDEVGPRAAGGRRFP
ncbi:hypothetical protein [Nocardioides abyssi]|uniref:Uncharacterized protein n=1 Tax=Nocardioides abyssi TaxID=3058370 RepID=A0ABT8EUW5_9ACTN|nr:hypothetical protein [Nocardioides abyssi]MDN4161968.1 hypothetical protein [Nocardioides abyssi]